MRRWPASSAEFPPRRLWVLGPVAAALGVAAERALYGIAADGDWIPDLVTGWCVVGCGLVGWWRRPASRSGPLLAATGFAWFVPNFAASAGGALGWLLAQSLYLHRGPLVAAVLTYPGGRAASRVEAAIVGAFCAVAVVVPVWRSGAAAIALSAVLLAVAAANHARASGRERRMRLAALRATGLVCVTVAATAAVRLAAPGPLPTSATLHAYQAMLCLLAIGLLVGLLIAPWERAEVVDLVVELDRTRSATLRDALARALGDPSLEVGYWMPPGGYVDSHGRPLLPPTPGSQRAMTVVERDGRPAAMLVHDPAVLGDPGLAGAVAAAARLAAANARLQAAVRARVSELSESRRRIIVARDEERARLERRLRAGAQRRLAALGETLYQARRAAGRPSTVERIANAEAQLARTSDELRRLARGIHPRELSEHGLAPALVAVTAELPLPVEVNVSVGQIPPAVESCAYFVCSEALANVAKYACATSARITVSERDGGVSVVVEDDGVGGASAERGTGLNGLADRVHALGGSLTIASPRGRGTRVSAAIPTGTLSAGSGSRAGRPGPAASSDGS